MRNWLYPYYCGAGRGARKKFRKAYKRWRKRVFRRVGWVFAGVAVALVIAAWLDADRFSTWVLGVVFGVLVAIYLTVRDSPSPYIEYWRTGAEGEQRTARALAPLRRDGFVLLHDLPDRRASDKNYEGNVDHVVISTAGVFLLDSKYLGGEASMDGDIVHVQMLDDDAESTSKNIGRPIRGQAVRLWEDIAHTGISEVRPLVVFWNRFPDTLVKRHRVVYLHGKRLAAWLQTQEATMTPDMAAYVAATIARIRTPEDRTWWERLATFRFHRQLRRAAATPPAKSRTLA
ncbi:MAG: nuclease-related domain-containing protein [Solirubrobacteraceae bacterium]